MGIAFGKNKVDDIVGEFVYEELVKDIRDRLYKAGVPNVHAIMSHVEKSLKHWGIDWILRKKKY